MRLLSPERTRKNRERREAKKQQVIDAMEGLDSDWFIEAFLEEIPRVKRRIIKEDKRYKEQQRLEEIGEWDDDNCRPYYD